MNKRIWLVSRHPGAQTWLNQHGFQGRQIAHLDIDAIAAGDIIIGSLPIHMVVALTLKSAEYWHLSMTIPECWRGTELTPEQMQLCQIKLQKITAQAEDCCAQLNLATALKSNQNLRSDSFGLNAVVN